MTEVPTLSFQVLSAEYLGGAPIFDQLPQHDHTEVALFGRSNVGKSTLVNRLTGRRSLARVSRTPGRTRAIHLFALDGKDETQEKYRWVLADLPGFGFAAISKREINSLTQLLEDYIENRTLLRCGVILSDIRREPQEEELWIRATLQAHGRASIIALTKGDKLTRNERQKRIAVLAKLYRMPSEEIVVLGRDMTLDPLFAQIRSFLR